MRPAPKTVYIALGSNMGDRASMLQRALDAMNAAGIRIKRQSSLYLTEAVGDAGPAAFLNAAVEAETALLPLQLIHALLRIERDLGRRRVTPHGPRTIDLDVLFYGSSVIRTRELEVPHPRLTERRFVLVPLAEIAPEFRHPLLHKSITQILTETKDRSEVQRWNPSEGSDLRFRMKRGNA